MDQLEFRPIDVLTSFCSKNEMQLVVASGMEALHDVGFCLFFPITKLGILQESATTSNFANYSC